MRLVKSMVPEIDAERDGDRVIGGYTGRMEYEGVLIDADTGKVVVEIENWRIADVVVAAWGIITELRQQPPDSVEYTIDGANKALSVLFDWAERLDEEYGASLRIGRMG